MLLPIPACCVCGPGMLPYLPVPAVVFVGPIPAVSFLTRLEKEGEMGRRLDVLACLCASFGCSCYDFLPYISCPSWCSLSKIQALRVSLSNPLQYPILGPAVEAVKCTNID